MPSAWKASRLYGAGGCLMTKPPLEPVGTITAFLTICALTSPRISERKSSRRSDQRMPPRAILPPRPMGMRGECIFDVGLRERERGLPQPLGVGAQNRDLAPAKVRKRDQPVEAVALHLAAPDATEGFLDLGARLGDVDGRVAGDD